MSLNNNLKKILIIDFGSQFTQLIARRIRELGVFSEIISHKKTNNLKIFKDVRGIVLSGGPLNVYQSHKIKFNKKIIKLDIPIGTYRDFTAKELNQINQSVEHSIKTFQESK